jgi:tol-pal system protein YbgF
VRRAAGERKAAIVHRAVTLGCGAVLLWCTLGAAHAALFGDDEARRQIAVEKQRVNELKNELAKQQEAVDARVGKLEEAAKVQPQLDLFTQLEALKLEMNKLRGQFEVLNNAIENTGKRQRDMYIDLDTRLRRLEQQGALGAAPVPTAPAAVAPAPAAIASPAAPAAITASPPAAAVAAADPGAESRTYDAAQGQRRIGNYQGAIVAFQNFIKQYPKSNLAPRAQYWIGDSYFNLRDFKLAIASQQVLIRTYPDSPSVPDAMLNIASSQIEMGESITGRRTLEELVAKYPVSDAADKAKRRLATPASATAGPPATGKP